MQLPSSVKSVFFNEFQTSVSEIELPERFTFPFYYEPHALTKIAAEELMQFLENQEDWNEKFGLGRYENKPTSGKMFGVLVVQNSGGELGYIAAFSGKLEGEINHFVPFVYNLPEGVNFYTDGIREIEIYGEK